MKTDLKAGAPLTTRRLQLPTAARRDNCRGRPQKSGDTAPTRASARLNGKREKAPASGRQTLRPPILTAGNRRSVGLVPGLALVAHRRCHRRDSNLAVAAIEVRHLGLGLRQGLLFYWHCNLSLRDDLLVAGPQVLAQPWIAAKLPK